VSDAASRRYLTVVAGLVERLASEQAAPLDAAAEAVAASVSRGGLVYAFGPGHQSAVASEIAYRAGGLAPATAMLDAGMTLLAGYRTGERFENLPGYGAVVVDKYDPQPGDTVIVVSQSGRNAAAVDVGLAAAARGCRTVAITSLSHSTRIASRHPSGRRLFEVVDIVVDTGVPLGDTAIEIDGVSVGPLSVAIGLSALDAIVCGAAELLAARGESPPCWQSSNLDAAGVHNADLERMYAARLRDL
jgi:uncharacterized phosphosugar-binding protein